MQKLKECAKTEWFRIRLMFRADTKSAVMIALFILGSSFVPVLSAWIWKILVEMLCGIYNANSNLYGTKLWLWLGLFLAAHFYSVITCPFSNSMTYKIERTSKYELSQMVLQKLADIDMEFYDDPEKQDALFAAQRSEIYISGAITTTYRIITETIALISCVALFLSANVWIGLLFMVTYVPGTIVAYKQNKSSAELTYQQVPYEREKNYYKYILTGEYYSKELRLYRLKEYFADKYYAMWGKIFKGRKTVFVKGLIGKLLTGILSYGGLAGVIVFSVYEVLMGNETLGTLVMFVELAKSVGDKINFISSSIAYEMEFVHPKMQCFETFLNYKNKIADGGRTQIDNCPEIEFQNVFFKYPGSEKYTIKDVSFKVQSGKKTALVGENGAGKSTIIKLLLRFYKPEKGRILIDHKDIEEYSLDALYRVFGVCFQDVSKYALTLKENIILSGMERDEEMLNKVISAVSLEDVVRDNAAGYDALLTREFDDKGIELSGGQWQKLAIARAFYRNSGVILLDEPSSALDPEAEDQIFRSIKNLCKDKSGIIISHRLSSMTMADNIVVLDGGSVLEQGTHEDLMHKDGKYAMLYKIQAEKYKGGIFGA